MLAIMRNEHIYLRPGLMVLLAMGSLGMNIIMIFILDVQEVEQQDK